VVLNCSRGQKHLEEQNENERTLRKVARLVLKYPSSNDRFCLGSRLALDELRRNWAEKIALQQIWEGFQVVLREVLTARFVALTSVLASRGYLKLGGELGGGLS